MERLLIGTDARWFIADIEMLFGPGVGEPLFMGLDLARGPDMGLETVMLAQSGGQVIDALKSKPSSSAGALPSLKRTHPTTARELRRAERRRPR